MNINGSELKITLGSFSEAMALQKAIGRALKGTKLDLSGVDSDVIKKTPDGKIDMNSIDLSGAGGIASSIMNLLLGTVCSDEVETYLFNCAARCLIGTEKVDLAYFEKAENRQNYYPIMVEIIKANCGPFINGLLSSFGGLGQLLGKGQK